MLYASSMSFEKISEGELYAILSGIHTYHNLDPPV